MEIIPRVLQLGNEAELLSPKSCRKLIVETINQLANVTSRLPRPERQALIAPGVSWQQSTKNARQLRVHKCRCRRECFPTVHQNSRSLAIVQVGRLVSGRYSLPRPVLR